jgi:molybdate/tungstate transport system permease protein
MLYALAGYYYARPSIFDDMWWQRSRRFDSLFALLGCLLVVFVVLPLAGVLLAVSPHTLFVALTDQETTGAITLTIVASAIATVLAILTGVPLALLLARRRSRGKRLVSALVYLPVVIPHTAAGIALLLVFGRTGVIGGSLAPLGLTFTETLAGVVVAMLFVSAPFLVNMSRDAFAVVDREVEQMAATDGASHWQVFRLVTLPLAWRGVLSGTVMMWARGMSEFGAVVILAYYPKTAPVLLYERFEAFGLDAALPVAALLIVVALVVFMVLRLVLQPERDS